MAPSWFGTSASESHHPIIQSSRLQTNPPKLEVTQQQDFVTRQDSMCLGPRSSVISTFNAPSKPRVRNQSLQVKLGWYEFNTQPYCTNFEIQNSWIIARVFKDNSWSFTIRGTKGGGQTGDDLGNQPVQIGVGWTLDVQVPAANIVECLVVLTVSFALAASPTVWKCSRMSPYADKRHTWWWHRCAPTKSAHTS